MRWGLGAGAIAALLLASCTGAGDAALQGVTPPPGAGNGDGQGLTCQTEPDDPGRRTLHRLNRAEYNNTVRDLLGDTSLPADAFPADDHSGEGFDNNADVLSMGPLLMEKYDAAATRLVEEAWARDVARPIEDAPAVRLCDPNRAGGDECARRILGRFMLRAWRRPVTDAEVARMMTLVQLARSRGDDGATGVKLGLRAVLLSPYFLYRVELDTDPTSLAPHRLSAMELATRLSYFLWSSVPDDELLAEAEAGRLHEPGVLDRQVLRMLEDPRADAFVENFAGQWLATRGVEDAHPDPQLFPGFDEPLKQAMRAEADLFFREFLRSDRPVRDMMDADFTYLNDRLAQHYGMRSPGGSDMKRISLAESAERGGLLGLGSLLTVNSHPDRTSPVKRGYWVLSRLLCKEPPPPPDAVEGLQAPSTQARTVRERMAQHSVDPACSGCHQLMDPIGFGLENYDPIGRWRTKEVDTGEPVDSSGELPDKTRFNGRAELSRILKEDPNLTACLTEHLMTYATGRSIEPKDRCHVQVTARAADASGGSLKDLVMSVVHSRAFQYRRGQGGSE
ncbi:MAG: DUF1592 domain-containing protein [Myxococcaceae bacterium]|nr:DUF1592 domain-containing protein [Myxococcaceae bacterium]